MAMRMSNDVFIDVNVRVFCLQISVAGSSISLNTQSVSFRTLEDILKDVQTLVSLNMEAAPQVNKSRTGLARHETFAS